MLQTRLVCSAEWACRAIGQGLFAGRRSLVCSAGKASCRFVVAQNAPQACVFAPADFCFAGCSRSLLMSDFGEFLLNPRSCHAVSRCCAPGVFRIAPGVEAAPQGVVQCGLGYSPLVWCSFLKFLFQVLCSHSVSSSSAKSVMKSVKLLVSVLRSMRSST